LGEKRCRSFRLVTGVEKPPSLSLPVQKSAF
jgi:hypothetical protein